RQIVVDLKRAAAEAPIGMRLLAVTARVIDHVPVAANVRVLVLIIRQQGLREIAVAQVAVVGLFHYLAACFVVNFPCLRGQIAWTALVLVALLHHFLSDLLLCGARNRGQARGAIADRSRVALLQLALARPLTRDALEHAGHHGGDAARLVVVTHRSSLLSTIADLPRSVYCTWA